MPEMIILIGLQASGKTTFYQQQFSATHVLVSKDRFPHNRNKSRRQQQLISEALAEGQSVVVDNTNPQRVDRAPIIQAARENGAKVAGYYFPPEVEKSLERNSVREGKKRIPNVAIYSTFKRLEEPCFEEGFDELYRVHAEDGIFQVVRQPAVG